MIGTDGELPTGFDFRGFEVRTSTQSIYGHRATEIAMSPGNLVNCHNLKSTSLDGFLAVGGRSPYNVHAELYNFGTGVWTAVQDYPFSPRLAVSYYDMVYVTATSAYYVIGGVPESDEYERLATIAMFKNGVWSDAGQLNTARDVSFCLFFFC